MSGDISEKNRWREMLRRQSLANARHWLATLEKNNDVSSVAASDYDNLLRALENTLQDPDSFDLAYRLVQALYFVAVDYADWDRWLIYLEKSLDMAKKLDLENEQAGLLAQVGDIYYHTGDLALAEASYQKAAQKSSSINDRSLYASTLTKLALIQDQQGKLHESMQLCQEALTIAEEINDGWVIAQASLNLSYVYLRSHNIPEGLAAAQRAYDYFLKQSNRKFADKALLNMVTTWINLGELQKVDEFAEELMDSLEAAGDIRNLIRLKNSLGIAAFQQENWLAAEAAWQEALSLHSQIQEPRELANLYNNLGMVYTKLGDWPAALEMLQKAVATYKQLGDVFYWANSLDNMADLFDAKKDSERARQVLQEAKVGLQPILDSAHARELLESINARLHSYASK
jgi:tetratricopeptide (TPR) repeat protein